MNDKLDERQVFIRNKIGNRCFILLACLLFAEVGLTGFGIRWMPYPADIIVILCVCLFIYLISLIVTGSYAGPRAKKKNVLTVLAIAIAAVVAARFILLGDLSKNTSGDNSGMTLFIISAVLLVIVLVISLIRKKQDKNEDE